MPLLPTFEVTQTQANRMMAVFGSPAGYQEWLKTRIIEEVRRVEVEAMDAAFAAQRDARIAEIDASLDIS